VWCRYTTVSARRFTSIAATASGLELGLAGISHSDFPGISFDTHKWLTLANPDTIITAGAPGEKVTITALQEAAGMTKTESDDEEGKGYRVVVKVVTIGADGTAKLAIH
jgi:hypothetical protein